MLKRLCVLVLLTAALGGCYVPLHFDAEVTISRTGHYAIAFAGDLGWLPLIRKLQSGALNAEQERIEAARIETDLGRDSATREVVYRRRGRFAVTWEKEGDLLATGMVTFVRRSETILGLKYLKDSSQVRILGKVLTDHQAQQLLDAGINISGELRVRTDAEVIHHNASSIVRGDGMMRVYRWRIDSAFDPPPQLVIALR